MVEVISANKAHNSIEGIDNAHERSIYEEVIYI